jgi:hypothetical protein
MKALQRHAFGIVRGTENQIISGSPAARQRRDDAGHCSVAVAIERAQADIPQLAAG